MFFGKKLIFILLSSLAAALCTYADGGAYSDDNRKVLVLPRNGAMAYSDICYSRDAALNSNPATIALDSTSLVAMSYAGHYDNAFSTSTASYVFRIMENTGFGLSMGYIYVPDIEITENLELNSHGHPVYDKELLEYSSASDLMFNAAVARSFSLHSSVSLALGARLHGLRRRLIYETGYGIGLDAGAAVDFAQRGIRVSLLVDDISTNYIYWGSSYSDVSLPSARIGVGWRKTIPYFYGKFTVAYSTPDVISNERLWYLWDGEKGGVRLVDEDETGDVALAFLFQGHYGLEYIIREVVALRGGFSSGRVSFGGGISLFSKSLGIDFAYITSELSGTYHVSAGYNW